MNASSSFTRNEPSDFLENANMTGESQATLLSHLASINSTKMSVLHIPVSYILRPLRFDIEEIESVVITPFFQGIKILIGDLPSQNSVLWMGLLFLLPFLLLARYFEIYSQPNKPQIKIMEAPTIAEKAVKASVIRTGTVKKYSPEELLEMSDEEIITLVNNGSLHAHALEKSLEDYARAVKIRRYLLDTAEFTLSESALPIDHYDYTKIHGQCCENVIGYVPIPVGFAGPFIIDDKVYNVPMATTEGCLVASTSRGCKAISAGGGARTVLTNDGMTRGPVVRFPSLLFAAECKTWIESLNGMEYITKEFNSTSRFAKLKKVFLRLAFTNGKIKIALAGRLLFLRFVTFTGDAMGMNMVIINF